MGGTTAKASLIEHGEISTTSEYEVGGGGNVRRWLHGTGHPIRVPVIDLAEVSAGGGSIAWIDPGGVLRVGPESAGAEPGPVCYGQGGDAAHRHRRRSRARLSEPGGAAGRRAARGSRAGARRHRGARSRAPLGLGVLEAAAGIVDVVNAGMAGALRIVSVERGHDPREFTLVAFGGAGPVHAARLAEELEIPRVLVPPIPGGFSALGLVATDVRRDYVRTFYARARPPRACGVAAAYAAMEGEARAMLTRAGVPEARWEITRAADCRYARQAYELTVPWPRGPYRGERWSASRATSTSVIARPTATRAPTSPCSCVNLRVRRGRRAPLEVCDAGAPRRRLLRRRRLGGLPRGVFKETGLVRCDVDRARGAGARHAPRGPADRRGHRHDRRRPARLASRASRPAALIVPGSGGAAMTMRPIPRRSRSSRTRSTAPPRR